MARASPVSTRGELRAALFLSASGTAFPLLGSDLDRGGVDAVAALSGLRASRFVRAFAPAVCLGARDHVGALVGALGWKPEVSVEYDSMLLPASSIRPGIPPSSSVTLRRAGLGDLDALMPIAEAYERAEVLTRLHVFDPAACRASQAKALSKLTVWVAILDGKIAGRAQTNAKGLFCDQLGGVFVAPEHRGKGLGRAVVAALAADIASRGKSATLFVKKRNAAARSLYLSLGFAVERDYTVAYFA